MNEPTEVLAPFNYHAGNNENLFACTSAEIPEKIPERTPSFASFNYINALNLSLPQFLQLVLN